jgi:membrane protease subunit (stomatin/prohibitin family)
MSLFGFLKKQLVAVIDWTESENGVLQFRFPMEDNEIQNGAQLTVRDSQVALFLNEGEMADVFGPGRHELSTKNLPVLTALNNWDKGFNSPFKSDVYFLSTREQIEQHWGTAQPVTVRDKDLGPLRIRAFGTYAYRLVDPKIFFKKVSGSRELYTTAELEGQLRAAIITSLASFLGNSEIPFLDMAANQTKFSETLRATLLASFTNYGLELTSFFVENISLPESVQEQIDRMGSMRMAGDLQKYAQFQAADSIHIAAANQSGAAGAGAGLGAGMAIGQTMANSLAGSSSAAGPTDESALAMQKLNQLHDLLKNGVLTQAEYDAKKAELLKRVT